MTSPIPFSDLTYEMIEKHVENHQHIQVEPDEFFKNGLLLDITSMTVVVKINQQVSRKNLEIFKNEILKDKRKFAKFLDVMWSWVG